MPSAAKLAYRPVGLLGGLVAGAIASAIFKQIWRRTAHEDAAPDALQSEYPMSRVLLAATIEGALFAAIKATIERLGARGFQKVTGSWPGD
jgi:hypothetical protein